MVLGTLYGSFTKNSSVSLDLCMHTFTSLSPTSFGVHILCIYYAYMLASYPGPFTRAVRAGREIRAWYQSFAHA